MYEVLIDDALEQFGDNASGLVRIVQKDLKKYYNIMKESIEDQDIENALISAHSCKSICSLINVGDALELVRRMEEEAQNEDLTSYEALYEEFS